jgi:hypothetical protein
VRAKENHFEQFVIGDRGRTLEEMLAQALTMAMIIRAALGILVDAAGIRGRRSIVCFFLFCLPLPNLAPRSRPFYLVVAAATIAA